jgi:hypothetical protein
VPAVSYWPEKHFYRVKFLAWGVAVELDDEFDDEPRNTRDIIKRQRKLGESRRPIDRLRAVVLGSALSDRLNGLNDRQIGQLLFDFCWPELYSDTQRNPLRSSLSSTSDIRLARCLHTKLIAL